MTDTPENLLFKKNCTGGFILR